MKAEYKRLFQKQCFYGEGESIGHMLALLVRAKSIVIPAITGRVTSYTPEIVESFKQYYEGLYSSQQKDVEGEMWEFFSGLKVPCLSR